MIARGTSGSTVRSRDTTKRGGENSRMAALMGATSLFQDYVDSQLEVDHPCPRRTRSETAAEYIRTLCGIASRADLDHNAHALYLFHQRIRKPFVAWQEGRI